MRPFPLAAAALLAAAAAQPGPAAAQQPQLACPPYLDVTPQVAVQAPPGWQARLRRERHWLNGADLFEGDPAAGAQLRSEVDRTARTTTWTIGPALQAPSLVCRYGGTEATLVREVPYGVRRCTVSTRREEAAAVAAAGRGSVLGGQQQQQQQPAASPPGGVATEVACR